MMSKSFLMFVCLAALAASQETTESAPSTTAGPAESSTAMAADDNVEAAAAPGPQPGAPPPGEGPEYEFSPVAGLAERCEKFEFPADSFIKQADASKVFLKVDETNKGPFRDAGITKLASAFGVHIVGDKDVDDKKLIHVANYLAKVLDGDNDGKPDNQALVEGLQGYHATIFVMSTSGKIIELMNADDNGAGFPLELKYCPFAFDFEEARKIVPNGPRGDATCDQSAEEQNDRALALVLDAVTGRGFEYIMTPKQRKEFNGIYKSSLDAHTFEPENTGCPPDNDECGKVMFASWALSTMLGFDTCWCEDVQALKFCSNEKLRENEPELVALLEKIFPNVAKLDNKPYKPKNKKTVVK